MNNSKNLLGALLTLVIIALLGAGIYYWQKRVAEKKAFELANTPMQVQVTNTPNVGSDLPAPAGFPRDFPLINAEIIESNTTEFQGQNAVQTSITFESSDSLDTLYQKFLKYLKDSGYEVSELDAGEVKSLSGRKTGANLNIALSTASSTTMVRVAHLTYEN